MNIKKYIVKINGWLYKNELDICRLVMDLDKKLILAKLIYSKRFKIYLLKITLKESRNRQLRRIISFLGFKVIVLRRVNFANILLDNLK